MLHPPKEGNKRLKGRQGFVRWRDGKLSPGGQQRYLLPWLSISSFAFSNVLQPCGELHNRCSSIRMGTLRQCIIAMYEQSCINIEHSQIVFLPHSSLLMRINITPYNISNGMFYLGIHSLFLVEYMESSLVIMVLLALDTSNTSLQQVSWEICSLHCTYSGYFHRKSANHFIFCVFSLWISNLFSRYPAEDR